MYIDKWELLKAYMKGAADASEQGHLDADTLIADMQDYMSELEQLEKIAVDKLRANMLSNTEA